VAPPIRYELKIADPRIAPKPPLRTTRKTLINISMNEHTMNHFEYECTLLKILA
jgi:hypothetical protein